MKILTRLLLVAALCSCAVLSAGVAGRAALQVQVGMAYSQTDSRWASEPYAFNPNLTIASDGCALTSLAMLLTYYGFEIDPPGLNSYMKREGLFAYDPNTRYNDYVNWYATDRFSQGAVKYKGQSGNLDLEIAAGRPVIARVSSTAISMHFVLVVGTAGEIIDPLGGERTTLKAKGYSVDGYRFYGGTPPTRSGGRKDEPGRGQDGDQGRDNEPGQGQDGDADRNGGGKGNPNRVIVDPGGWMQATIISSEASGNAEFGKRSPNPFALFADSKVIGANKIVGYFPGGTELVFYINATYTSQTYLSTDSAHCRIERPEAGVWVLYWEDWTDNDFDDFVIRIEYGASGSLAGGQQVFEAAFAGTTSKYYTNIRSGPGLAYKVVGQARPDTRLEFDAYTYGTGVTDIWLGTLDYRWYRIKGTEWWVASAVVKGNAPGTTPSGPLAVPVDQGSQPGGEGQSGEKGQPQAQVSGRAYNAVEWAKQQEGKARFPLVGSNQLVESSMYCALFVATAYGARSTGAPVDPKAGCATAKTLYNEMKGIGAIRTGGEPEYGALVFFDWSSGGVNYGHVGIFIGDGMAVSAGKSTIVKFPYDKWENCPYLGWSPPPQRWIGRK